MSDLDKYRVGEVNPTGEIVERHPDFQVVATSCTRGNSGVQITTNNVPRELLSWWDLSEKEDKEFNYLSVDDQDTAEFFRYKGSVYHTGDAEHNWGGGINPFPGWDGWYSETFFSGVVFKFVDEGERVVVGRYCS